MNNPIIRNAQIEIKIPTSQEEFGNAIYYISETDFFEEKWYSISLPKHKIFDDIKKDYRNISNYDLTYIKDIYEKEEFSEDKYFDIKNEINSNLDFLNQGITEIKLLRNYFDFKIFDKYIIKPTLYWPWWNYNYGDWSMLIRIWDSNILNTILHEIIHIGIEKSIIQKYNLTYEEKERIVNLIELYLLNFNIEQNIWDSKINDFIKDIESIHNLPQTIERYITRYPR